MTIFFVVWGGAFVAMTFLAIAIGAHSASKSPWAIFIDSRNRWSLSQFQLVTWTFVGVPLLVATAAWRSTDDAAHAWDFDVPGELLALMGISLGSMVSALALKSTKDGSRPDNVAARPPEVRKFADIFFVEEGTAAMQAIDIAKFQNFIVSAALLLSYIWIVIQDVARSDGPPAALPAISEAMIGLLALSHGGYLVAKIPNRPGKPTDNNEPHDDAEVSDTETTSAGDRFTTSTRPAPSTDKQRPGVITVSDLTQLRAQP